MVPRATDPLLQSSDLEPNNGRRSATWVTVIHTAVRDLFNTGSIPVTPPQDIYPNRLRQA